MQCNIVQTLNDNILVFLEKKIYSGQAAAIVTDQVPETLVSGFGSAVEKWVLGKLNEAFLHLYVKF